MRHLAAQTRHTGLRSNKTHRLVTSRLHHHITPTAAGAAQRWTSANNVPSLRYPLSPWQQDKRSTFIKGKKKEKKWMEFPRLWAVTWPAVCSVNGADSWSVREEMSSIRTAHKSHNHQNLSRTTEREDIFPGLMIFNAGSKEDTRHAIVAPWHRIFCYKSLMFLLLHHSSVSR